MPQEINTQATKNSQRSHIIRHLLSMGEISAMDLAYSYGIGSPRKRLSEIRKSEQLKKMGYELRDKYVEGHNRYGEPIRYKVYYLEEISQ